MLPMLLGLAGSGLAGAGMLGGMGALTAGALGSGLGSYIETGDLGQGIQTGLMSFLGGKALGSMMGGATGATPTAAGASAGAGTAGLPGSVQSNVAANLRPPMTMQSAFAAPPTVPTSQMPSVFNPNPVAPAGPVGPTMASADASRLMAPKATTSFGEIFNTTDPTKGLNFGTGFEGAKNAALNPYTLGAAGTAGLMMPPPDLDIEKKKFNTEEAEAYDKKQFTPGAGFRPGIDKEFDYFSPTQFADGGLAALRYAEGGDMDMSEQPNDKELISEAVDAIKGKDSNPEITLARFVSRYGEDALRDLVGRVQSGEFDQNAETTEGKVSGVGDGMDDMIPATLEGEQDVVLSDGEFIVPADVVSGLGNGSTDAGSKSLYEMMDRVREMRTGGTTQPKQVPQSKMLPA